MSNFKHKFCTVSEHKISLDHKLKRTIRWLLFLVLGMFAFTFALVPLYSVFCKATGLNGKVELSNGVLGRYPNKDVVQGHVVTVEFDSNLHPNMPFVFTPDHPAMQVTPGILTQTSYTLKNLTNKTLVVQAIPSISPGIVAKYLKKLECFCFNRQVVQPYEVVHLPLRFWLEPEFPDSIHRLTLSYTLFDVTQS